jgi:hypothetical protein
MMDFGSSPCAWLHLALREDAITESLLPCQGEQVNGRFCRINNLDPDSLAQSVLRFYMFRNHNPETISKRKRMLREETRTKPGKTKICVPTEEPRDKAAYPRNKARRRVLRNARYTK